MAIITIKKGIIFLIKGDLHMKFWIWFGCLAAAAIIITFFQRLLGVSLGLLFKTLIAATASSTAIALCKNYSKKVEESKKDTSKPENTPSNDDIGDDNGQI